MAELGPVSTSVRNTLVEPQNVGVQRQSSAHQAPTENSSGRSSRENKAERNTEKAKDDSVVGKRNRSDYKDSRNAGGKKEKDLPEGGPNGRSSGHSARRYHRTRNHYHYDDRQRGYGRPRSHGNRSGRDKVTQDQEAAKQARDKSFQDQMLPSIPPYNETDTIGPKHETAVSSEDVDSLNHSRERGKSNTGRRKDPKPHHRTPRDQISATSKEDDTRLNPKHDSGDKQKLDPNNKRSNQEMPRRHSGQDRGRDGPRDSRSDGGTHYGRGRDYKPRQRNFRPPQILQRERDSHKPQKTESVVDLDNEIKAELTTNPNKSGMIDLSSNSLTKSVSTEDTLTDRSRSSNEPTSLQGTKSADRNDYTKRKPDRLNQQPRFKGRHRGQRSTPTIQSDQLAQELTAGTYECMVCCERVRVRDQVWSCDGCYHVFHLKCIKKWASAPVLGAAESTPEGWQCPSCRKASTIVPTVYRCFCGRVVNPRPRGRGELTVPHSCGETCLKSLAVGPESSCRHKCRLPCHPGPCPFCPVMVTRTCPCGKQPHQVRCSRTGDLPSCGSVCGHGLACGRHTCEDACHSGPCRMCEEILTQQCHCGHETRQSTCGQEKSLEFSCGQVCKKELDCGNHLCERICHEGACPSCPLLPSAVTTCPCGATPLSQLLPEGEERVSCFDPVPTCEQVCRRVLPCSTNSADPHRCLSLCHLGACPPCDKTTSLRCRCGASTTSVPCVELVGGAGVELMCGRVCNKKKSCGRHRCNARCCVDTEHKCELLCGKRLQCGRHFCAETCHRGHCEQCWEYSYTELTCHCGAEVIHPPIACGTRPPPCTRPCARMHPCGHPVNHPCHSDENCPPCTFLTEKMCMGGHELRTNIPCHLTDVSCGVACGRPLSCGMHKCQRTCHRGNCDEFPCRQPCTKKRKLCDHQCGEPCHVGRACPDTPCQSQVELRCECGRRKERVICMASESGTMRQAFQMFSKELGSSGGTINISTITATNRNRHKPLECDEVCRQMRRNRELAAALDIERPIVNPLEAGSSGELVQYSPYLLEEARANLEFVAEVEEVLRALVEMAVKSPTSKSHKHTFRPMKSNQRKIIHELSVYYGCETTSFDLEPLRNVTVYATKSQVKLPPTSLTKLVERERYKPPPAPLHVMTVSGRTWPTAATKLNQLAETNTVTDYFADDLKL